MHTTTARCECRCMTAADQKSICGTRPSKNEIIGNSIHIRGTFQYVEWYVLGSRKKLKPMWRESFRVFI